MTIPDAIKHAYLAVAAGSKPHEREAARAIVWAVAGWLEAEFYREHQLLDGNETYCEICIHEGVSDIRHDLTLAGWLMEADRLLRETEGKKNG